ALIVRDKDVTGAIGPAPNGMLRLCHLGVQLESRPYAAQLASCEIVVDSDAIVPDVQWMRIADDAGVGSRVFVGWEIEPGRAIAHALVGEQSPDLVSPPVRISGELARALATAVLHASDPRELLGGELAAKLCACALFGTLGSKMPHSVQELASTFATSIPYVE